MGGGRRRGLVEIPAATPALPVVAPLPLADVGASKSSDAAPRLEAGIVTHGAAELLAVAPGHRETSGGVRPSAAISAATRAFLSL